MNGIDLLLGILLLIVIVGPVYVNHRAHSNPHAGRGTTGRAAIGAEK